MDLSVPQMASGNDSSSDPRHAGAPDPALAPTVDPGVLAELDAMLAVLRDLDLEGVIPAGGFDPCWPQEDHQ